MDKGDSRTEEGEVYNMEEPNRDSFAKNGPSIVLVVSRFEKWMVKYYG